MCSYIAIYFYGHSNALFSHACMSEKFVSLIILYVRLYCVKPVTPEQGSHCVQEKCRAPRSMQYDHKHHRSNTVAFPEMLWVLIERWITQVNRMCRSRRVLATGGKQRIFWLDMVCIETILFHLDSFWGIRTTYRSIVYRMMIALKPLHVLELNLF